MREHGLATEAVLAELDSRRARDPDIDAARLFGLVYPTGRDDLEHVIVEANRRFLFGNALNPFKFAELASLDEKSDAFSSRMKIVGVRRMRSCCPGSQGRSRSVSPEMRSRRMRRATGSISAM